jgi:hypothetical protein
MLDWRWLDKASGTWTALVHYRRDGLPYLHWVAGELLDVEPENAEERATSCPDPRRCRVS